MDAGTIVAGFKTERLMMSSTTVMNISVEDVAELEKEPNLTAFYTKTATLGDIIMNTNDEVWSNADLRKALWLALDRWEFQETFGAGKNAVGAPFIPDQWYSYTTEELKQFPGFGGCEGCPRTKQEDIDLAVEFMKESGLRSAQLYRQAHPLQLHRRWLPGLRGPVQGADETESGPGHRAVHQGPGVHQPGAHLRELHPLADRDTE